MCDSKNLKDVLIEENLFPPKSFSFPFTPYKIQHDFMTNLYSALENKKLGIFESPTGTGKTLSIICGSMSWLLDHEKRELRQFKLSLESHANKKKELDNNDCDWLNEQSKLADQERKVHEISLMVKSLEEFNNNIEQLKKEHNFKKNKSESLDINILNQKNNVDFNKIEDEFDEETECVLEEYDQNTLQNDKDPDDSYPGIKIYFCSRTHSQLTQFIREIKKTPYSNARLIPLASRKNYCINETVKNLNNLTLINEKCLEINKPKISQKSTNLSATGTTIKKRKTATVHKCIYNNKENIQTLAEEVILEIRDIEEIITRGHKLTACPYYASRQSMQFSQIIVLPYNTLLHKSTRETSGIRLENNIFIFDEAHNLLNAIEHIYSSQTNGQQLSHSYTQLNEYKNKFETRCNAIHLLHLNQLIFVIEKLIIMLGETLKIESQVDLNKKQIDSKMYTLEDFVHQAGIDHLNLFTLVDFFKKSKIGVKIQRFSEKYMVSVAVESSKPKPNNLENFLKNISEKKNSNKMLKKCEYNHIDLPNTNLVSKNPLTPVIEFIESLTYSSQDGRILCTRSTLVNKGILKFVALNPAIHFKEIVDKARSVILAGGTMEPISEFKDQLFYGNNSDRIVQFSCGHIIPSDNILPLIICSGPSGKQLDFSYESRTSIKMLSEIGTLLENVCRRVPAGIVCFFSSFDYEQMVYDFLEKNNVIKRISEKKQVFREPKSSNQVDEVLKNYSQQISLSSSKDSKLTGSLLFSVIGGKLSEGLNFTDDLGRCIIVIGLPYPNIKSVELQEKMQYLNNYNKCAGQKYYENLCIKSVNQTIGRSIRHQNDYATVLLLDYRYQRDNVRNALPKWIQSSLQVHTKFGPAFCQINKFFHSKSKLKC